jgi:hypothetical protein
MSYVTNRGQKGVPDLKDPTFQIVSQLIAVKVPVFQIVSQLIAAKDGGIWNLSWLQPAD